MNIMHKPAVYGLIIILVALVMIFVLPTQTERTMSTVTRLLIQEKPLAALKTLESALKKHPGDQILINASVTSANLYLDSLSKQGDYQEAYIWLKQELEDKSYLQPLHSRLNELDAYVTDEKRIGTE